jgi:hypothetical protein
MPSDRSAAQTARSQAGRETPYWSRQSFTSGKTDFGQAVTSAAWRTGLAIHGEMLFRQRFCHRKDVIWCFGSAGNVIGDSAIAVRSAVPPHDSNSDAAPTAGTNKVSKVGWIIVTGNAAIGVAARKPGPG